LLGFIEVHVPMELLPMIVELKNDLNARSMKRIELFHRLRHPAEMGAKEVEAFLTHLSAIFPRGINLENPLCTPIPGVQFRPW
jgi:hypothetical protein